MRETKKGPAFGAFLFASAQLRPQAIVVAETVLQAVAFTALL
jgi:hypothetical protein